MQSETNLTFPIINKVKLQDFSLYTLQPDIQVEIPRGVFVLAGANGLGKSTFLTSVNFALTGMVPNPDREFSSLEQYYKTGIEFSKDFFDGRIRQNDREGASITLEFQIRDRVYEIERGIFEATELRRLRIYNAVTQAVIVNTEYENSATRNRIYQDAMILDTGVKSFEQFVFLQHLVFTFDESRHLILWDEKVLTTTLNLVIGQDPARAERLEVLRREMERADSRARNKTYQAGNVQKRLDELREALNLTPSPSVEDDVETDFFEQYEQLDKTIEEQEHRVKRKEEELEDIKLQLAEVSSRLSALNGEYQEEFEKQVAGHHHVELNSVIVATLSEHKCSICGSNDSEAIIRIKENLEKNLCPLCGSALPMPDNDVAIIIENLKRLDAMMLDTQSKIDEIEKTRKRLQDELHVAESKLTSLESEKAKIEEANKVALFKLQQQKQETSNYPNSMSIAIDRLRDEIKELRKESKEQYEQRDKFRDQLIELQQEVEQKYVAVELDFIPLFKELATLFLGIDLDVRLKSINTANKVFLGLDVEIRGNVRREVYQLSESQRFFLDIALRMALANYVVGENGTSYLFIDTPEGSLDIAYESRAGQMFARFADINQNIIMTANINSSQMLIKLAQTCGTEKMALHRMTSWTELSDVQADAEELFQKAYVDIENAMQGDQ